METVVARGTQQAICGAFVSDDSAAKWVRDTMQSSEMNVGSAGLVVANGSRLTFAKNNGLITEEIVLEAGMALAGHVALGQIRSNGPDSSDFDDVPPSIRSIGQIRFAVSSIADADAALPGPLSQRMALEFATYMDRFGSHPTMAGERRRPENQLLRAFWEVAASLQGKFLAMMMNEHQLVAIRSFGWTENPQIWQLNDSESESRGTMITSRDPMVFAVTAIKLRQIQPGELVVISRDKMKSYTPLI